MALEPTVAPKTYQDVKSTLRWYNFFVSIPVALFLYVFLVPDVHRKHVEDLFSQLSGSKIVTSAGSGVLVIGAFLFVSWFLVFVFEIHDKIYDSYVIRWRHFYDLDVILPALTRPFGQNLDPRFFDVAGATPYAFMKPFYHFVADGEHEDKITENLVLRFYETITKYWLTQINEVLFIAALIIDFVYLVIYRRLGLDLGPVAVTAFLIVACFAINRLVRRFFLGPVRRATLDEIEDIHKNICHS